MTANDLFIQDSISDSYVYEENRIVKQAPSTFSASEGLMAQVNNVRVMPVGSYTLRQLEDAMNELFSPQYVSIISSEDEYTWQVIRGERRNIRREDLENTQYNNMEDRSAAWMKLG